MAGGREAKKLAVAGRERADKDPKVLVHPQIGIRSDTLPVVVSTAINSRDGIALPLTAGKEGRRVPDVGVEDHDRAGRYGQ